jgi:chromosome segregation ATPase
MPLGLWKSKWEIHREDMERFREEMRDERAKWDAESRDLRRRSDEIGEETRDLRADYDREIAEARLFNRDLLIRLEKTYANLGPTLELTSERIVTNTEEVKAQTAAILKLVDRFEDLEGRPPV